MAMGQHEGLADGAAAHLVKIADVDELKVAVQAQRSDQPGLGIVLIKAIDLVQRRFDGKSIVTIYRCSAAEASRYVRERARENRRARTAQLR